MTSLRVASVTSWVLALTVSVLVLVDVGHSLASVLLVAAYWGWSILLPGAVLHRCLFPGRYDRMTELGRGAVAALSLELVWRMIAVHFGMPWVLWAWPVVVLAVAIAVPTLRARVRCCPLPSDSRVVIASGALSAAAVVMLWSAFLRAQRVPNAAGNFYPDLMFHLGIARNLEIETWPSDPQVAGNALQYHWFADSHIATVSMATGIDTANVVFHLWLVPMLLLTATLLSALARQCVDRWWVAAGLVWFSLVGTSMLLLDQRLSIGATNIVTPLSPSQVFAAPVFLALVSLLVGFLRGQREASTWVAVGLTALAASGTKPTILPMLTIGVVAALATELLQRRRLDRGSLGMLVLLVGVMLSTQPVLVGSTGGSSLGLLSLLRAWSIYRELSGDTALPGSGAVLPSDFTSASAGMAVLGLVVAFFCTQILLVLGLLALLRRRLRVDEAVPFLAGTGVAGWAGLLLLDHPGVSEYYFLYTATPVLVLLTLWLLADLDPGGPSTWWLLPIATGLAVGGMLLALRHGVPVPAGWLWLWIALAVAVVLLLATVMVRVVVWRSHRVTQVGKPLRAVSALLALLAFTVPLWLSSAVTDHQRVSEAAPPSKPGVSEAEIEAGRWLREHAAKQDVVVTNVHCLFRRLGRCDARGFWVAGLSGRRVFLGGWGYTSASMETADPRERYTENSSPWPARLHASNDAIEAPSKPLLGRLYRRGVRWILADGRYSRVSPRLSRLGHLRLQRGKVKIFELKPPELS